MSRTDKDKPAWVFAKYYEPRHDYHCVEYVSLFRSSVFMPKRECDLPDEPLIIHRSSDHPRWRPRQHNPCTWEPSVTYYGYDEENRLHSRWWDTVPKWYVDHRYHNRLRTEARDSLRAAMKEYNACGETDIEPFPEQARNSAKWDWS